MTHSAEKATGSELSERIAQEALIWSVDDDGIDVPTGLDMSRLRQIVAEHMARAWDGGYQTCLGDFDIAARREACSANPYRPMPPGGSES